MSRPVVNPYPYPIPPQLLPTQPTQVRAGQIYHFGDVIDEANLQQQRQMWADRGYDLAPPSPFDAANVSNISRVGDTTWQASPVYTPSQRRQVRPWTRAAPTSPQVTTPSTATHLLQEDTADNIYGEYADDQAYPDVLTPAAASFLAPSPSVAGTYSTPTLPVRDVESVPADITAASPSRRRRQPQTTSRAVARRLDFASPIPEEDSIEGVEDAVVLTEMAKVFFFEVLDMMPQYAVTKSLEYQLNAYTQAEEFLYRELLSPLYQRQYGPIIASGRPLELSDIEPWAHRVAQWQ